MSKLQLSLPEVPVYGPADDFSISPLWSPRACMLVVDVRTTGLLYFSDDTENAESRAYNISMVTCVLDDSTRPIPFDALTFRVAVPGYLTLNEPLTSFAERLRGVAYYHSTDMPSLEKARIEGRTTMAAEGVPVPYIERTAYDYEAGNPEHGVRPDEAVRVIRNYVNRFQGGVVVVGQNLRLTLEMLDRMGIKLDVEPPVYHRMIEMYSIFLAGAMGGGSGLSAIPGLTDVIEVPAEDEKNPLKRGLYIASYLMATAGVGDLPAALYLPYANYVGSTTVGGEIVFEVEFGNAGMSDLTIGPTIAGDGFSVSQDPVSVAGGSMQSLAVSFTTTEVGVYQGVLTLGGQEVALEVTVL